MAKVLRLLLIVIVVAGAAGGIYAWVGSHGTDENGNTLVEAEIGSITEKAGPQSSEKGSAERSSPES